MKKKIFISPIAQPTQPQDENDYLYKEENRRNNRSIL